MKHLIAVNAARGRLSLKTFEEKKLAETFSARIERIGQANSFLIYTRGTKRLKINFSSGLKDHRFALKEIIKVLPDAIYKNTKAIGHRISLGGELIETALLSPTNLKKLKSFADPVFGDNVYNLKVVEEALRIFPRLKQFGVFDTALFKDLPDQSKFFPLNRKFLPGLVKHGSKGLAHEQVFKKTAVLTGKPKLNLISLYLDDFSSLCVFKDGKVHDCSSGLSQFGGLMSLYGTGDLDPYLPLMIQAREKVGVSEAVKKLAKYGGFHGLTGFTDLSQIMLAAGIKISGFKPLSKVTSNQKKASKLAWSIYFHNLLKSVGGYVTLLGKVEAMAFSGKIGENCDWLRREIIKSVRFAAKPRVFIVKPREEEMIAEKIKNF